MQEDSSNTISLEAVEFIFRHPWVLICTIIILFNTAHAYISSLPLSYKCTAVLSFELVGDATVERRTTDPRKDFVDARKDLVSKALLGENIRNIIEKARPALQEKTDPAKYNKFIEKLRNPKTGIQVQQDDRNNINLVIISFIDKDPELCYKIVRATVDTIISENKKTATEKVQAKITFLNKQIEFYKSRLGKIEKEMDGIKSMLVENFPRLNERERDLIAGITGDTEMAKQQRISSFAKYDETLAQLSLDLLDADRKRENLQKQLSSGAISIRRRTEEESRTDLFLEEYSKAIAAKELEIADLTSGGYKMEHPQIKKLQSEINQLRELRKQRIGELSGTAQVFGKETARERISAEIEDLDFEIESLKNKIDMIKEYRRGSVEQFKPSEIGRKDIAEKAARLMDLDKEKTINEGYYLDIRKQLEEADLKGRIEKEEAGLRILTIEEPKIPVNPIPLQKFKPLVACLIGSLAAGLGLAHVLNSLDSSVRTNEELRKLLALPVLATIDKITTAEEIALKRLQRRAIITGLIVTVIATRVLIVVFIPLFINR